jgi:hypothetical protein
MAAKILAFLITMLANIAAGVAFFFGMLLAMNGYSESDANYGIIAYIALAIVVTILMSAGAVILVNVLTKRKFSGLVSALIAVPLFSIFGVVLKVVCSIIGIGIAEFVRVNY